MNRKLKNMLSLRKWVLFGLDRRIARMIPDRVFVKLKYWASIGRKLRLDPPVTFTEKIQWQKLYDRRPVYTAFADKVAVRQIVAGLIGQEYLIELLGVYRSYDEIDFDALPDRFVLKANHTSGNVFLCLDKRRIDHAALSRKLEGWMKREYFWVHREWPYKDIEPRIVCEAFIGDDSGAPPFDYKFFCFNGEPKRVSVYCNRFSGGFTVDHYDTDWNYQTCQHLNRGHAGPVHKRPGKLEEMVSLARVLAQGLPQIRVDLYFDFQTQRICFGELTLSHLSGFTTFHPPEYDDLYGSWITLPAGQAVADKATPED
jgi:hypothetical protein